jgi:ABC-type nitrate/sulfonate/bicarbonate transport system substrate-binding protein
MLRRQFLFNTAAAGAGMASALPLAASCARAAPPERVNIVLTSATTNLVLTALMEQTGYLAKLGIEPNFLTVADGNKVVAALVSGAADICPEAGFAQVLAAIARGAPLKMIGGSAPKNFNAVFTANPKVRTLKDLEGKTVGVGALGTQLHQIMIALFRKYGVDAKKVTFANVGASVNVFKAVQAHVVDAGPCEVWVGQTTGGPGTRIVEHGATYESLPEYVNQAAFTSDRAIAQKRQALVKTLAAYSKLFRYITYGDAEQAFMAASAKALGPGQTALAKAQWQFYRQTKPFAPDLALGADRVKFMQDLNISTGTQTAAMPFEKFADMSLARDALKLAT